MELYSVQGFPRTEALLNQELYSVESPTRPGAPPDQSGGHQGWGHSRWCHADVLPHQSPYHDNISMGVVDHSFAHIAGLGVHIYSLFPDHL